MQGREDGWAISSFLPALPIHQLQMSKGWIFQKTPQRESLMLAPAHPDKNDPSYSESQRRFKRDKSDHRRHPERWGVVHSPPDGTGGKGVPGQKPSGQVAKS